VRRPVLASATARGVPAWPEPIMRAEIDSLFAVDIVLMERVSVCTRWSVL
jgi:hypothetical protein